MYCGRTLFLVFKWHKDANKLNYYLWYNETEETFCNCKYEVSLNTEKLTSTHIFVSKFYKTLYWNTYHGPFPKIIAFFKENLKKQNIKKPVWDLQVYNLKWRKPNVRFSFPILEERWTATRLTLY